MLLGVAVRHSWLRAWWVLLCVLAVSGSPAARLAGGVAGFPLFGFACVACVVRAAPVLWCVVCVCGARVSGGCGGVCCVHARACVRCVGGAFGCLSSPFWAWFGGPVWCGGCVPWPPPCLGCVVPRPPWLGSVGGVSPCRPLCVPSSFCLFSASLGAVFLWCRARAFPAVVGGGGGPCRRLGSLPLVFPRGGADACTPRQGVTLLYGPSICTRSVQMDLLRSQVLQPFPTPGSGTLWVAGESLRDRRVSCLPRWTVCPTRSPSLGPNRSTCRGECSWSGPLVTPPDVPPRAADQQSRAYPTLLRVLRWGGYGHRGGAQTPEVGSLACVSRGPFSSRPPFRCAVCGGWCPVSPGWGGGGGGGGVFAVPGRVACVRVAPSFGSGSPSVCVFVARCVRVVSVLVCGAWFVVCGVRRWCVGGVVAGVWCGWSLATPGRGSCVLLPATPGWVSLPVVVCGSPPLLAGVPLPAVACGVWCVLCGVWCVVSGGRVLVGLWLVCGVVGPSPLLAEVPVCYSPPLLVEFRCRWWWAVLATPG